MALLLVEQMLVEKRTENHAFGFNNKLVFYKSVFGQKFTTRLELNGKFY